MATLSLIARFPLGVYYGHQPDKAMEFAPSPARLHSALLNSASQGSMSDAGMPTDDSLRALRWLESNPPDGLYHPGSMRTGTSRHSFIYREVSSINSKHRTEKRRISDGVAVSEYFGYRWSSIPDDISNIVVTLAEDVSCLGEAQSIAVLEEGEFEPNLLLDHEAHAFTVGGQPQDIPLPGRTDELIAADQVAKGKKVPSVSSDKVSRSELPKAPAWPQRNLTRAIFRTPESSSEGSGPWKLATLFKLDKEVPTHLRVELSTAMHRAIISRIGQDVTPVITGKYLDDSVERPANRLAIQYLPPELGVHFGVDGPVLALFIPNSANSEDVRQIAMSQSVRKLWSKRLGDIKVDHTGITISSDEFWPAPSPRMKRLWKPLTPIVAETRRVPLSGGDRWTLADSCLLSIAFVWRDDFPVTGKGSARYIALRDEVLRMGTRVFNPKSIGKRSADYAHRQSASVPTQPYTATIDLGELASERTAIMIGQSRHLGGGLLVPVDIPVQKYEENTSNDQL